MRKEDDKVQISKELSSQAQPPLSINDLEREVDMLESKIIPTVQALFEQESLEKEVPDLHSAKELYLSAETAWMERAVAWALYESFAAGSHRQSLDNASKVPFNGKAEVFADLHLPTSPLPEFVVGEEGGFGDRSVEEAGHDMARARTHMIATGKEVETRCNELCQKRDELKKKMASATQQANVLATPKKSIFTTELARKSMVQQAANDENSMGIANQVCGEEELAAQAARLDSLEHIKVQHRAAIAQMKEEIAALEMETDPLGGQDPNSEEIRSLDPQLEKEITEHGNADEIQFLKRVKEEEEVAKKLDQLHQRHTTILGNVEQLGKLKMLDVRQDRDGGLDMDLELFDRYPLTLQMDRETMKIQDAQLGPDVPEIGLEDILKIAEKISPPNDKRYVTREVMERLHFLEVRKADLKALANNYEVNYGPEENDITVFLKEVQGISVTLTLPSLPSTFPRLAQIKSIQGNAVEKWDSSTLNELYKKIDAALKHKRNISEIIECTSEKISSSFAC